MSNITVPLLDLKPQYQAIKEEIQEAINGVIESQYFILGPEVQKLEEEIAEYCQAKHCLGVSSGSDALLLSLMALGVTTGDEVITTTYTFFATAGAISRLGATPVLVDIDPASFNILPEAIEKAITPKTKAIIPVHLYGQCADMDEILKIANEHDIPVVEDGAQAIGSEYKGKRAGSMGTAGCFSFFPSKNLGAFGDGGAITTNDSELYEKMKCLRMHGSQPKYHHKIIGGNFRLDAIQAVVVRVKLQYLDSWTEGRQKNAALYNELFESNSFVTTPPAIQNRHIYNQFIIRVENRDELRAHLAEQQIGSEIYYPIPMHLQECFADLGYTEGSFPEAEKAASTTLALPIYPELSEEQIRHVATVINQFCAEKGQQSKAAA
jgi:dTDP-4-amino-4,6-dideoxygalactose transaminase